MSKNSPERWARIVASRLAPDQVQRLYDALKSGYFDFMNELAKCSSEPVDEPSDERMLDPAFREGWTACYSVNQQCYEEGYERGFQIGQEDVLDRMIDHRDAYPESVKLHGFIESKVLEERHR